MTEGGGGRLAGELPLDTRVADWGLMGMSKHIALTSWVPGRTLVGSDGEAGGTNQTWGLGSLLRCPRWGVNPCKEVYLNTNPWAVPVIIQFKGRLS